MWEAYQGSGYEQTQSEYPKMLYAVSILETSMDFVSQKMKILVTGLARLRLARLSGLESTGFPQTMVGDSEWVIWLNAALAGVVVLEILFRFRSSSIYYLSAGLSSLLLSFFSCKWFVFWGTNQNHSKLMSMLLFIELCFLWREFWKRNPR